MIKIKTNNNIIISFVIFFLVITITLFLFFLVKKSNANFGDNISGYAWSENIGWISFNNCINPEDNTTCTGNNYGVTYNSSTGYLSGYAWSENIGWIKFGSLSSFPTGDNTVNDNAKITLSGINEGKITGWARACAGTVNGDCTGASRTDGWDGWISLKGTNYNVNFNPTTGISEFPSFAWGSDVVGWINFSGVKIKPFTVIIPSTISPLTGPSCVLNSSPVASIGWSSAGMTSCQILENGASPLNVSPTNGGTVNITVPNSPTGTNYSLRCYNSAMQEYNSAVKNITRQIICNSTPSDKKPGFIEI